MASMDIRANDKDRVRVESGIIYRSSSLKLCQYLVQV